jgi:2,5-diketo-D-gluconate reductase A
LYRAGRVKAIGVSNFHPDRVMDLILHNEVKPALDQVEIHPFHQQVQTQKFLQENDIQTESWGPFAEGRNNIFHNDVLRSIGEKYGKSIAQVIVRWLTQRNVIAIPKSVRKERMAENFNVFDLQLDANDMAAIATLDTGQSAFFNHRDPEMVKTLSSYKRNT